MTAQVSSNLRAFSQDSYGSSGTEEPYLLAAHGGSRPIDRHAVSSQQSGPPEDFVCPISLDVMRDPVTLVETGQNFDRPSLERWFKTGAETCPLTRVQLSKKEMRSNVMLQNRITIWSASKAARKAVSLPPMQTSLKQPTVLSARVQSPRSLLSSPQRGRKLAALLKENNGGFVRRFVTCFKPPQLGNGQEPTADRPAVTKGTWNCMPAMSLPLPKQRLGTYWVMTAERARSS